MNAGSGVKRTTGNDGVEQSDDGGGELDNVRGQRLGRQVGHLGHMHQQAIVLGLLIGGVLVVDGPSSAACNSSVTA